MLQNRYVIYNKVWDSDGKRMHQPFCIQYHPRAKSWQWMELTASIMWQKFEFNEFNKGLINFLLRNYCRIIDEEQPHRQSPSLQTDFGSLLYYCYNAYKHGKFKNKSLQRFDVLLCDNSD
jgi:hypothetical protein